MPQRSVTLLLAALLFVAGCGEEKSPPAPDVDPPEEGGAGRPDPPTSVPEPPTAPDPPQPPIPEPPKEPKPSPPETPPDNSAIPHVILLRSPKDPPTTLVSQIRGAAESADLKFESIPVEELGETDDPKIIIATFPLPPLPESAFQNPKTKLILVGTPEKTPPPCTALIQPDDLEIGKMAGRWLITEFARRAESQGRASIVGNVVQIRASDDDRASNLRHAGFLPFLDQHAGVIFVHDGPGFWREADAKKRMEEALRIQKDIRAVFAHSDEMARGAVAAIEAFRAKNPAAPEISLISVGGNPKFAGVRTSSTSISLLPLAEKAIEIATRLVEDPTFKPPAEIQIPPLLEGDAPSSPE